MAKQLQGTQVFQMGLGEVVKRLMTVEFQFRIGNPTNALLAERTLLLKALDRINIDVEFDCNDEYIPTLDIFQQAAATSCCRLMPFETSRRSLDPPVSKEIAPPETKRGSRRQPVAPKSTVSPPTEPPPETKQKKKKGLFGMFGKED